MFDFHQIYQACLSALDGFFFVLSCTLYLGVTLKYDSDKMMPL